MIDPRRQFGNDNETLAAQFLASKGFVVVASQYRTRVGEIDLVCLDGKTVVFVEVKARRSAAFGDPVESVTPGKLTKIAAAGEQFIRAQCWESRPVRIDVIGILWNGETPSMTHLEGVDTGG